MARFIRKPVEAVKRLAGRIGLYFKRRPIKAQEKKAKALVVRALEQSGAHRVFLEVGMNTFETTAFIDFVAKNGRVSGSREKQVIDWQRTIKIMRDEKQFCNENLARLKGEAPGDVKGKRHELREYLRRMGAGNVPKAEADYIRQLEKLDEVLPKFINAALMLSRGSA